MCHFKLFFANRYFNFLAASLDHVYFANCSFVPSSQIVVPRHLFKNCCTRQFFFANCCSGLGLAGARSSQGGWSSKVIGLDVSKVSDIHHA